MQKMEFTQMVEISGGAWQDAVGCIGGAAGWIGSIAAMALVTAATPIGAVALAIISYEANGVLTAIACGKWASN